MQPCALTEIVRVSSSNGCVPFLPRTSTGIAILTRCERRRSAALSAGVGAFISGMTFSPASAGSVGAGRVACSPGTPEAVADSKTHSTPRRNCWSLPSLHSDTIGQHGLKRQFGCGFRRLSFGVWLRCVGIFEGLVRVRRAIFVQFRVAQIKMALGRVILRGRELSMQFVGAYVRCILVSHAAGVKCSIVDRNHILARFCFALSDCKCVFTGEGFCLKADELDDDIFAHGVPGTDSLPPKRKGGPAFTGPPFALTRGW